jgi:sugar lactone lactonase YvrE
VRRRAVDATAALAFGLLAACAAPAVRGVAASPQAEIAQALGAVPPAKTALLPSAVSPLTLTVLNAATPLRGANGLACFDQHVFVAEALGDRVLRLSADGSVEPLSMPPGLRGPDDLVFDDGGALFVTAAASGEVWRRGPEGSWRAVARGLPGANGIARDRGGRLFVGTCALGDALYEIDPTGSAPPRKIAHDLGCPNAMVADDAGALVVPLLAAGKVVRIRVADGASTVLADGLRAPSAVKHAPDGSLVVLESATGVVRALADGAGGHGPGAEITRLAPGLDGFTACGESALVSNFVTGAVTAFKPWPASSRVLEPPGLASPHGLAQAGDDVLLSDGVSIRRLRQGSADVLAATAIDSIPPPYALALAPGGLVWVTVPQLGEVHRIDLVARTTTKIAGGFDWPTSIAVSPHGGAFVVDTGAGRIVELEVDGSTRVVATGLIAPVGLALRGLQLVTLEREGGRVIALREGNPPALVASGLASPTGIAADPSGRLFVAEERTGAIVRVDADGSHTRIAQGFDFHDQGAHAAPVPLLVTTGGDLIVAQPSDGSVFRIAP